MSRRVSLPGADELFRTTGGMALQAARRQHNGGDEQTAERLRPVPAPGGEPDQPQADGPPDESAGEEREERAEHSGRGPGEGRADGVEHRRREAAPEPPAGSVRSAARQVPPQPPQAQADAPRRKQRAANRRPSGRERHDEKITVYVSAEELMDLEHARLVLRGEHGLAVDRGRIVREAVAVVLSDLESRGDASILVRRLRGR